MLNRILVLLAVTLVAQGCGSAATSTTTAATTSKDLFSSWSRVTPSTGLILDFTGKGFSTSSFTYTALSGAQCTCTITFSGTQASGTVIIASCTFKAGTATSDPGCSSVNSAAGFTNSAGTLTMCPSDGSTCTTWN